MTAATSGQSARDKALHRLHEAFDAPTARERREVGDRLLTHLAPCRPDASAAAWRALEGAIADTVISGDCAPVLAALDRLEAERQARLARCSRRPVV